MAPSHRSPTSAHLTSHLSVRPEVAAALAAGAPVVALESTIISHGLPRPDNLAVARQIEQTVRDGGAVPATIAVVAGKVCVGLDDDQLSTVATSDDVVKVSVRDLGTVVARGGHGATTVASTSHLAALAGISVFATGGLGGVHRGARDSWDESAALTTLGTTAITIVCAGVKSILDVGATLERLETLNIGLLGYRTDRFPGFYLTDSGFDLEWRVDSPAEVAAVMAARHGLRLRSALLVANPLPPEDALDRRGPVKLGGLRSLVQIVDVHAVERVIIAPGRDGEEEILDAIRVIKGFEGADALMITTTAAEKFVFMFAAGNPSPRAVTLRLNEHPDTVWIFDASSLSDVYLNAQITLPPKMAGALVGRKVGVCDGSRLVFGTAQRIYCDWQDLGKSHPILGNAFADVGGTHPTDVLLENAFRMEN